MADVDSGLRAFHNEDYAAALAEFTELANEGNPKAQYWLGLMHESGDGVRQDYLEARKWFERAADQGEVAAQMQLAGMYLLGHGGEPDLMRAHMWFDIASKHGMKSAEKNRDSVARKMTKRQLAKAEELAREREEGVSYCERIGLCPTAGGGDQ